MNETYRVGLGGDVSVVVRIARQSEPWFADEAYLMAQAREAGVPTPQVLGLEQLHDDGALLTFSIQEFLPGRMLDVLIPDLAAEELERLVVEAGELLARVHSVAPDR